ncbi:MAG: hypothetical protein Q8O67_04305 [Deltaproteobacteria bacterium]|nr:hypothetical protein [Deltaproteobacteria bacterium]
MRSSPLFAFLLPLLLIIPACGADEAPGVGALVPLGWVEGQIDPQTGAMTLAFQSADGGQALTAITEDRNGAIGSATAVDSVEVVVECNGTPSCPAAFIRPQAVVGGCGNVDSFDLDVTLRGFFASSALSVTHMEFTSVVNIDVPTNDNTLCNSDPVPRNLSVGGTPLSNALGLYRYGHLAQSAQAPASAAALAADTARWRFQNPGGRFKFKARVLGETCTGCTPANHVTQFWQPEGATGSSVNASAEGNGVVFVGGSFNYVGPRTGSAIAVGQVGASDAGLARLPWPAVEGGDVHVIVPDGSGGFFLGGNFTSVGGAARAGLAQVLGDGTVAGFAPAVIGNVRTLARDGTRLIVGGLFTQLAGQAVNNLGAVVTTTGGLDSTWTAPANGEVRALFTDGTDLYVGGAFTAVGATPAARIARVSLSSGVVDTGFAGAVGVTVGVVSSFTTTSTGDIVLGGSFSGASVVGANGTQTRSRIAAVSPSTLNITPFAPVANSDVLALQRLESTIFLGGNFTTLNGGSRPRVAAVDEAGSVLPLRLNLNRTVAALAVDGGGTALYIGGSFAERAVAVSPTSNGLLNWPMRVGNNNNSVAAASTVLALAVEGSGVALGGTFRSAGGVSRLGAAAVDLATGEATAFAPFAAQETANAMTTLPDGDVVIGTASRVLRATAAGAVVWQTPTTGAVRSVALDSANRLYVGGSFATVGGQPRVGLAALESSTGAVDVTWAADANSGATVHGLAVFRGELYAGGDFSTLQGAAFPRLAAISPADGTAATIRDAWAVNGTIFSVAAGRDAVFAGGAFSLIDGVARSRLAAVDGVNVTPFNVPVGAGGQVNAIVATGNNLHIGGTMTSMNGVACNRACSVNTRGTSFGIFSNSPMNGAVQTVSLAGTMFFAGGNMTNVTLDNGNIRSGAAVFNAD